MKEEEIKHKAEILAQCICCPDRNFCKTSTYKCDKYKKYLNDLEKSQLENEVRELKTEIKNYSNVINQLMGTRLDDIEEVGRLIEIAQYRNWGEL